MMFEIYEEKCNLAYLLKNLCCEMQYVFFHIFILIFVIRIIAVFTFGLIYLIKFKRGQGQTSVILFAIKFLKTIKCFTCQIVW